MSGIGLFSLGSYMVTMGDVALAVSTLAGVAGDIAAGEQRQQAAEAQAVAYENQATMDRYQAQLAERAAENKEIQAIQEKAAAQRNLIAERKKQEKVAGRVTALTGAGGGGSLDPTIIDLLADIEGEGELRAGGALYSGEERARALQYEADVDRAQGAGYLFSADAAEGQAGMARSAGEAARTGSYLSAAGTLAGGYTTLESRMAKRGPTSMKKKYGSPSYYDIQAFEAGYAGAYR